VLTYRERFMIGCAAAAMVGGAVFTYRPVIVTGPSMQPTLSDHQVVLMDRQLPADNPLRRGDIVVFRHGAETYVKRVFALAGDTVEIVRFANGSICVAGDGMFSMNAVHRLLKAHPLMARVSRLIVPTGGMFVLGDNRSSSVDSRQFGTVPTHALLGKIITPREAIATLPTHLLGFVFPTELNKPSVSL
jgi:signal peptidase I